MGNRIKDIEINCDTPFQDHNLNRMSECNILTNIVKTCDGEGVISLNGSWGCGKTTFLKIWRQHLSKEENAYTSLYFNAWENDYLADPLVGLLGELKEEGWFVKTSEDGEKLMKSTLRVIGSIAKTALKSKIKDIAGIDCDDVADTIQEEFFNEELDEYTREKNPIKNFREALTNIVHTNTENGNPLVFIIDELDRCTPSYAVKMLERVKHLFSIPNVVFVLSIDKEQLANSVRGYYGSESLNAEEYLRRFIDVEYNLPKLNIKSYINYISQELGLDSLFKDRSAKSGFDFIVPRIVENKSINLRLLQKIFTSVKLGLKTMSQDNSSRADLLFVLAYMRLSTPVFYAQIRAHSLSIDEYVKGLEELFAEEIEIDNHDYEQVSLHSRFSLLVVLYNNHRTETGNRPELLVTTESEPGQKKELTFNTTKINRDRLTVWVERNLHVDSAVDIEYYIDKLELVSNFVR